MLFKGGKYMENCCECNYKFTFFDRLKGLFTGKIKCRNCFSRYVPRPTFARFLYFFTIIFSNIFYVILSNFYNISYFGINGYYQKILLAIIIEIILFSIYDLFPHKFSSYKNYDN